MSTYQGQLAFNGAGSLAARSPRQKIALLVATVFFLTSIVCFFVHFFWFRYSIPPNNLDEATFFSPSQNLAEIGRLSSTIHSNFLAGADRYTYWMPPLYMVLLGGVFKVFGATVLNAKIFSFFLISLAALLITLLSDDRFIKICLAGLFLICPYIIISSAFIRMEALAVLLIVAGIIAVRFQAAAYVTGILAGLMVMTHPMLVPCSIGLALHAFRKDIKSFIIFCAVALITISPYILYILKDFGLYKTQMGLQLARKSQKKLSNLKLDYIIQSVPVVLIAFYCLFILRKATELRIFLGTAMMLTLLLLLRSDEFNYQVYIMPFVIAIAGLVLDEKTGNIRYSYAFPLALYAVFCVFLVAKLVKYKFRSDTSYTEMISYLSNHKSWQGKNIYVDGRPDISTFLMMNHQQVQRRNAVASGINANSLQKFNYVIEVIDNETNDQYMIKDSPWQQWGSKSNFTTSDSAYSLRIYSIN